MFHVEIDSTMCTGHGRCYTVAPGVFGCDDDGFGVVVTAGGEVDDSLRNEAQRGADSCPERAIAVT